MRLQLWVQVCAAAALLTGAASNGAGRSPDPRSEGPYPVGVTTAVLVDRARTDSFTGKPRTLVTEIWYPAADEARSLPKNRYTDFIPGAVTPEWDRALMQIYKKSAAEIDEVFWNLAARDAPVRPGKFPIVVFSHGNGGTRYQNTFWCDYLASHGYIVASADHTGNARMTMVDGQLVPYQPAQRLNSARDRPKDMSFLLDELTRWNEGGDRRFTGRIDIRAAAAAGMSFGSFSAFGVVDREPRFKAVIGMSGALAEHANLDIPALAMIGTEDRTIGANGNAAVRNYHAKHRGPAFLLELKNGGHYSFTDMFKVNRNFGDGVGRGRRRGSEEPFDFTSMERTYEIINSVSVAFCGLYLKGETGYLPFLSVNHWPEDVIWAATGLSALSGSAR